MFTASNNALVSTAEEMFFFMIDLRLTLGDNNNSNGVWRGVVNVELGMCVANLLHNKQL